jgi:predicted amidohydrolase
VRIAVLQAAATPGDVAANLATIEHAAADAAAQNAALLVAPETFTTGYGLPAKRWRGLAEPLDGPTVARLRDVAAGSDIAIVCGVVELAGSTVHSAAVFVDRRGELLQAYRKTHLFGDIERETFAPGEALDPPVALDGLRVGLLVCNDLEFPEAARALAARGADLIAVPTALMSESSWIPETLVPARAGENQIHVAYANHVGGGFAGRSVVAGPNGRVVSAGPEAEELLVADLDLDLARSARARQSYLAERRPELY